MSEPVRLTDDEHQQVRDWWDHESGGSEGGMLQRLDATVETILTARVQAAEQRGREHVEAAVLAVDLQASTEGSDREGTATWPARDRDVYSLAVEECAIALRAALSDPTALDRHDRVVRARALEEAAWEIVRGAGLLNPPAGQHPAVAWLRDRAAAVREGR